MGPPERDFPWTDFWQRLILAGIKFAGEALVYFLLFFAPSAWQAKSIEDLDEARNSATAAATVAIVSAIKRRREQ
jgi:hypothetical protein